MPAATDHAYDALFNLRDLGGHPTADGRQVRTGRVVRADGLHRATAQDRDRLAAAGLRVVIDLRTAQERLEEGSLRDDRFARWHIPLVDEPWAWGPEHERRPDRYLAERYVETVETRGGRIAAVLEKLAVEDEPVAFHCSAGKDRAGIVAAILLALLGVPDDAIAEDYRRSEAGVARMVAWFAAGAGSPGVEVAPTVRATTLGAARPETILELLGHLRRRHGSIPAWLEANGAEHWLVDRLRVALLI